MMMFKRIAVIREKAEDEIGFRIRQVADFELLQVLLKRLLIEQQDGDDDQSSERFRYAALSEVHLRKRVRRQEAREKVIHDLYRELTRWPQQQDPQGGLEGKRHPPSADHEAECCKKPANQPDRCEVDPRWMAADPLQESETRWFAAFHALYEFPSLGANEI